MGTFHIVRTETRSFHFEVEADSPERALARWKQGEGRMVGEDFVESGPLLVDEKHIATKTKT